MTDQAPDQFREAMCTGKHRYPTGATAYEVASRSWGKGVVAYRCQYCRKFHVGTNRTVRS